MFDSDKCTDCKSYLDYVLIENNQLCFEYKTNNKNNFNKELIKRFANIYEFCNGDINKFICCSEKVFLLMNIWIAAKDLMKHYCLINKLCKVV